MSRPRASATRQGRPRSNGSSRTPQRRRPQAARDRPPARRWSARCAGRRASACWRDRRRRCSRRQCSQGIFSLQVSRLHSRIRLEPDKAVGGLAARIIFAADEAGITEPVEFVEQERIVQLLAIRLVARGDAGDLDVADHRHHLAQPHRNVAMDDLAVIDVELEFQVRKPQLLDQVAREAEIIEEVAGHIARIDRLEHDVDAVRREELGGPRDRFVERLDRDALATVGDARHQMQPLDAGRLGVGKRGLQARLELGESRRECRKALLAGIPIARRQVEQRLSQAVALEPLADRLGRMLIGKEKLDGSEAGCRSGVEAVEERHLGEHHREIGGKAGHGNPLVYLSPGSLTPVTCAYIRATDASSSRPMPAADVIKNIWSAAAETGTGNLALRAMSWMMPRSLTKISTALLGV